MRKTVYRIAWYRFYKNKIYYCTKHDRIINNTDKACKYFKLHNKVIDLSAQRFDNAINDIEFLIEYLKNAE